MALITEKSLRQLLAEQKLPTPFPIQVGDKLTPAARDFLLDRKIPIIEVSADVDISDHEEPELFIPVGVSNRHAHLCEQHFSLLFGETATLTEHRPLSQPGHFAAKETVTIVGPKGVIQHVRILGPFRKQTQIEISRTDGYTLGIHPPIRLSGDIIGTPGITIVGPAGSVTIHEGLIIAKNHVHMSEHDAERFGVNTGDSFTLFSAKRGLIFHDVIVRVNESSRLECHLDLDEANAAHLLNGDHLKVIGKNNRLFSCLIGDEQDG